MIASKVIKATALKPPENIEDVQGDQIMDGRVGTRRRSNYGHGDAGRRLRAFNAPLPGCFEQRIGFVLVCFARRALSVTVFPWFTAGSIATNRRSLPCV
jgi:hypothetical protein